MQVEENYVRIQYSMIVWTPLRSFYSERILFSGKCVPLPSLSDIDILWDSVLDLQISTRSVTVNTFNWLRRNFFWPEELSGGLATGWFVIVTNSAPHFFVGKFLRESTWLKIFQCRDVMQRARQQERLLVSLDISQHNALVIFTVKRSAISEIS